MAEVEEVYTKKQNKTEIHYKIKPGHYTISHVQLFCLKAPLHYTHVARDRVLFIAHQIV